MDMNMKQKIVLELTIEEHQELNIQVNVRFVMKKVFLIIKKIIMFVYLILNWKRFKQIISYQIVLHINYKMIIH